MQDGPETTLETVRTEASALLENLSPEQCEASWNLGPTTGSILGAMVAHPDHIWCDLERLDAGSEHPATSTVYVRPPRTMQIAVGPSQFYEPVPDDEEYEHPAWCECTELMDFVRDDLGLDHTVWPDEMLPQARGWRNGTKVDVDGQWIMLWWD